MSAVMTTRSALLQALRLRPGYGLELIRRLQAAGIRLAEARAYPVLKEMEAERLVESLLLTRAGRRGARTRIYYRLTAAGAAAADKERQVLMTLLAPPSPYHAPSLDRQRMAARIMEAEELSDAGEEFRLPTGR
jgi:DNA-binding PadR family transcriptional regulator